MIIVVKWLEIFEFWYLFLHSVSQLHLLLSQFTFHQDHALLASEEPQQQSLAVLESSKAKLTQMAVSREVRSFQRRLLTAFGNETDSDLLKFNQLKVSVLLFPALLLQKLAIGFDKSHVGVCVSVVEWGNVYE